jgi:hypothetical protein
MLWRSMSTMWVVTNFLCGALANTSHQTNQQSLLACSFHCAQTRSFLWAQPKKRLFVTIVTMKLGRISI